MMQGIRKKLVTESAEGETGRVYIVKREEWGVGQMAFRAIKNTVDSVIIMNPISFRPEYANQNRKVMFLHELGHAKYNSATSYIGGIDIIRETIASLYGFFKYREMMEFDVSIKDLYTFFKRTWRSHIWNKQEHHKLKKKHQAWKIKK